MNNKNYIFVKHKRGILTKIYYRDIIFINANKDYCRIVTPGKSYLVYFSMNLLARILPADTFCRCHRSFIVNVDRIDEIEGLNIHIDQNRLPIGELYKDDLLKKINFITKYNL